MWIRDRLYAGLQKPTGRRAQTRDPMAVQGARLQRRRHLRRVFPVEAVNSASAHLQRPDRKAGTNADASGSLGAVKSLVARKAQDVDPHTFHIHGDCARRLRSVYDKQKAVLFCEGCRTFQILSLIHIL